MGVASADGRAKKHQSRWAQRRAKVTDMDPRDPQDAHTIVSDYIAVLESHLEANSHPASTTSLPHPKETIKIAILTSALALQSQGQLTEPLRDALEQAIVALADYVDPEVARLLHEYREAGATLAAEGRRGADQVGTAAWRVLSESGRLVGAVAQHIVQEAEALREEFRRALVSG